jgi:hypothetical protein
LYIEEEQTVKKIINAITAPFIYFAVLLDESRRTNEDGSWDKYHAKKNCKAELRELKANYKRNKAEIRSKWRIEE